MNHESVRVAGEKDNLRRIVDAIDKSGVNDSIHVYNHSIATDRYQVTVLDRSDQTEPSWGIAQRQLLYVYE